jgi:hypothetical protein
MSKDLLNYLVSTVTNRSPGQVDAHGARPLLVVAVAELAEQAAAEHPNAALV